MARPKSRKTNLYIRNKYRALKFNKKFKIDKNNNKPNKTCKTY